MPFRDRVHSALVQHAHYAYAIGTFDFGKLGASDTKFGTLIRLNEYYSMVHDFGCCGALCTCNARAR